jgi:hypothetical protein
MEKEWQNSNESRKPPLMTILFRMETGSDYATSGFMMKRESKDE